MVLHCWKSNPGPFEEQPVFLTAGPSFKPQEKFLNEKLSSSGIGLMLPAYKAICYPKWKIRPQIKETMCAVGYKGTSYPWPQASHHKGFLDN